jgi:hypothetical protein
LCWLGAYLAFSTVLVSTTWPFLENFPPVTADEVWIMSASVKLADEGVLGSDIFVGLHGADRHYFLNLPAHHFYQATVFKLFGAGVAQARAPSLVAAIVVLGAVGWLAYKWLGLQSSLVAGILLTFWRSNLIGPSDRPPLLALGASGRYDITVLSCWWLTILTFGRHLDTPRRMTAIVSGLLGGLTALTHYYGVGVLLGCVATLLWTQRDRTPRRLYAADLSIGALVPICLYAAYVLVDWPDFVAQGTIHADRLRFHDPRFFLMNLVSEWRRFEWLRGASGDVVGGWMTLLAIPLTFLLLARWARAGETLAFTSALAAFLSLACLDTTKARIYASLLVPVLCLGMADAMTQASGTLRRGIAPTLRSVVVAMLLICVVVDGAAGYVWVTNEGRRVSPYRDVGHRIAASLEPQGTVLGSQRWWWALRALPYVSLSAQWELWKAEARVDRNPDFHAMLESVGAAYLILDDDTRADLTRFPAQLRQEVHDALTRATRIDVWRDPTYGLIEIYRF